MLVVGIFFLWVAATEKLFSNFEGIKAWNIFLGVETQSPIILDMLRNYLSSEHIKNGC